MAWKGEESEGVTAMSKDDIKWAQWLRVARNFQLRVGLKDRKRETFDGFLREVSPFVTVDSGTLISLSRTMTNWPLF